MRRPVTNQQLNALWISRKRSGLGQKSVARLLGIKSRSPISEYETGRLLPNLRTALKLSAIYAVPVNELYGSLYGEIEQEVEAVRKKSAFKSNSSPQGAPNT
jgi:transcriptional regulator with XRE-family HTH domain